MDAGSPVTPLPNAVDLLKKAEARLQAHEQAQHEPIAVVGLGCRFPGHVDSPELLWELLRHGGDAITEVPSERWDVDEYYDPDPGAAFKMTTRWGGFLDRVDEFDAEFFGVSPREAIRMDPQQRLLLEVAWEALERAGLPPPHLARSKTGVFIGFVNCDYQQLLAGGTLDLDVFSAAGCASSILANRISYALNLRGPSLALDTACSSSLVTVHLACDSLRRRESDLALAGGVNLILTPQITVVLSKAQMLSPVGRCQSFAATADGYVRGEGCGLVVLKRLRDALAAHDRILAVIRGSAVNHSGRGNGLAAPNCRQQETVIRAALQDAQLEPADVDYIETHGTGTKLGDPVEFEALLSVFGPQRPPERPLLLGSVKTNIGHLESAAGIAGLIKTVLALQQGAIPPHLHLQQPNPLLHLERAPVDIPTQLRAWPRHGPPRRAGVSSFGFGGMNAHVVVEEAPPAPPLRSAAVDRPRHLLAISARSEPALREVARRYDAQATTPGSDRSLADLTYSANTGRAHFTQRLAVVADSWEQLHERLQPYSQGRTGAGLWTGECRPNDPPQVAFLFTGQGSQYAGMARQLYDTQPTFRQVLDECDAAARPHLAPPLLSLLDPDLGAAVDQTGFAQPALFAVEVALARLWQSWGITAAVVLGHSVGEYAAACVAGMLSPEAGMRLITERGRLMQSLPAGGLMAAVFADETTVAQALAPVADRVAIAALNGPQNTVISGDESAVRGVLERCARQGLKSQALATSHAFHAPHMDPILGPLEQAARAVSFAPPQIPIISNLTGQPADAATYADPAYWSRHARQPVRFADGLAAIERRGCRVLLEIGPQPALLGMGRRCWKDPAAVHWLPSLRRGRDDWETLLDSLAQLYLLGAPIDWTGFDRDYARRRCELPVYPFQRKRFWPEASDAPLHDLRGGSGPPKAAPIHPLLGRRVVTPLAERIYETQVSASRPALLSDHRVQGQVVVPGAAYAEMGLAAAVDADGRLWTLERLSVLQPLILSSRRQTLQTVLTLERPGLASFRIVSVVPEKGPDGPTFVTHAAGQLRSDSRPVPSSVDLATVRARFRGAAFDQAWRTRKLRSIGLDYGPAFQWAGSHWVEGDEALGQIPAVRTRDGFAGFHLHPGVLDEMFRLLGTTLVDKFAEEGFRSTFIPVGIEHLRLLRPLSGELWAVSQLQKLDGKTATGDVRLYDASGVPVAECRGVQLRRVARDWLARVVAGPPPRWLYEMVWVERELEANPPAAAAPGAWLVFDDARGLGRALAARLEARQQHCRLVPSGQDQPARHEAVAEFLAERTVPWCGVVYLAGLDLRDAPEPDCPAARQYGWGGVLELVQRLTTAGVAPLPRLWLVARGTQPVGRARRALALGQSPLWGLGRVISVEYPDLQTVRVDLDPADGDAEVDQLLAEIWPGTREDLVAFRRGRRYVGRLRHADEAGPLPVPPGEAYRLEIKTRGELDKIQLRRTQRFRPGPGQVELKVQATGLNFRDVLNVLNLYPGDPGPLGGECAGEVVAVGPGVHHVQPGDAVFALAPACFSSYATTLAEFVLPRPAAISSVQAATLPIAFATAVYALRHLGGIRVGSRVLIHSASGGVGLAAIQVARQAGAEILVTAGNEEKRQYLRDLGLRHVMNSRSLDFADQVREATGGQGVDMVLNTLTGEAIAKGLAVLAPHGHFLELGKTDLWDQTRVSEVHPTATFHAIALDQMMADEPDKVGRLMREVLHDLEQGVLQPLPVRTYGIADAVSAFRHMARAEHIGKIALEAAETRAEDGPTLTLRPDATYLVTGGLGGLGLKLAQWLADHGARSLLLLGRSQPSAAAQTQLDGLRQAGVQVHVRSCDVSQRPSLASVLAVVARQLPPLAGVFHLAAVLDDGLLRDQTRERFDRVLAAKACGAWHLHELTQDRPLDQFVLFSSIASFLAGPAQGNYAAANSYLDSLAHERRRQGLPALAVNWGNWGEVGMAARLATAQGSALWDAIGLQWIDPARGLQALERLLIEDKVQTGVFAIDWPKFFGHLLPGVEPPWLAEIAAEARITKTDKAGPPELLELLKETPDSEQFDLVVKYLRQLAGRVLALAEGELPDPRRLLNELGFDSLAAVEFCNAIGRAIGQPINPMVLFDYPTLESLSAHLARDVLHGQLPQELAERMLAQQQLRDELSKREDMLERIEGLTSEDMEAMIDRQLSKIRKAARRPGEGSP